MCEDAYKIVEYAEKLQKACERLMKHETDMCFECPFLYLYKQDSCHIAWKLPMEWDIEKAKSLLPKK